MYKGEIKKKIVERVKKRKFNYKGLLIWYIETIVSFIPIIIDILVKEGRGGNINKQYWISICLKADILWVLATIFIFSVFGYFTENYKKEKNNVQLTFAVISAVLWGICLAIWIIFKYNFKSDYSGILPIILTVIFVVATLICCSPLQVKRKEE